MSKSDPTATYQGANAAHKNFLIAIANAKALAYTMRNKSNALQELVDESNKVKQLAQGRTYALGVVGRATTTTVQAAIHLTSVEIDLVESHGGFRAQIKGLIYREIYRIFETYLLDLFGEIVSHEKRLLNTDKQISHERAMKAMNLAELHRQIIEDRKADLSNGGFAGIEKEFEKRIGLEIVANHKQDEAQDAVRRNLVLLAAVRNIGEHNQYVVNDRFLGIVNDSKYSVGDRIVIDTPMLGDALSAVQWTVDDLNQRAIAKFNID